MSALLDLNVPITLLNNEVVFPPVEWAEDGILAIGGDLSSQRLMLAYQSGIFPWYNEGDPVIWWSPDPRCVLFPKDLHISRSMRRVMNSGELSLSYNSCFEQVIELCSSVDRPNQKGTWITSEMKKAYINLHNLGKARSVEVWKEEKLCGGMYGIDLGKMFCGESMFSLVPNASKFALIRFVQDFENHGGVLLDCQVGNDHLFSMGAKEIPREEFIQILSESI